MKTKVKITKTNIETYGSHPPYYTKGDEGYIDGYYNDYALVVLDNHSRIALVHFTELIVLHQIKLM